MFFNDGNRSTKFHILQCLRRTGSQCVSEVSFAVRASGADDKYTLKSKS